MTFNYSASPLVQDLCIAFSRVTPNFNTIARLYLLKIKYYANDIKFGMVVFNEREDKSQEPGRPKYHYSKSLM